MVGVAPEASSMIPASSARTAAVIGAAAKAAGLSSRQNLISPPDLARGAPAI